MNKFLAIIMIVFVLLILGFSTWQLFLGNFEAAFSGLPFLLVLYLFLKFKR